MTLGTLQFMPRIDPSDTVDLPEDLALDAAESFAGSAMDLLNGYAPVFFLAFIVALLSTPVIRRIAEAANVVDRPDCKRKMHSYPVAYLGGLAVFLGISAGIAFSMISRNIMIVHFGGVPMAVIIGMVAIMVTGLADDLFGWDPRLKIMGQLIAAAALALGDIGVRVAAGILIPMVQLLSPQYSAEQLIFEIPFPIIGSIQVDFIYWTGTAIIAIFVLGGCNATNLIDGLDGLLSGVVGIIAMGLLAIAVLLALVHEPTGILDGADELTGARIILCTALLGAVLGFLPWNFNPASIFLGDCGSMLLGYLCVVLILMLGQHGETHLVFAGLIIFAVPIMDTALAIVRRTLSGKSMSTADDQHIHHQLKRSLGGVKKAVFALYGISFAFALVGVTLAALVLHSDLRIRVVYTIAIVLFSFIGVIAIKSARSEQRKVVKVKRPAGSKSNDASRPSNDHVTDKSSSSSVKTQPSSTPSASS